MGVTSGGSALESKCARTAHIGADVILADTGLATVANAFYPWE